MTCHHLLVCTTRPQLLARQVLMFCARRENALPQFFFFSDDASLDKEFTDVVDRLKQEHPDLRESVYLLSVQEQKDLLSNLATQAARRTGLARAAIMSCFMEDHEFAGIRSIQNRSIALFYLLNGTRDGIVHRLDDDVLPIDTFRMGNTVRIAHNNDFYGDKERGIEGDPYSIRGSQYVIDSPSPLAELLKASYYIRNFLRIGREAHPAERIATAVHTICPASITSVHDETGVLQISPPPSFATYAEVLQSLPAYIDLLDGGMCRLTLNDGTVNGSRPGSSSSELFPGGCVSFDARYPPVLTPWFGNQDLLSQLFETVRGRPVRTEGFVGHVKVAQSRVGLIEDLMLGSRKHQTSVTYAVASHFRRESVGTADFPFLEQMTSALQEATSLAREIRVLVGGAAGWMSRSEFADPLERVDQFYRQFLQFLPKIQANFSAADIDTGELIANYRAHARVFRSVLACARLFRPMPNSIQSDRRRRNGRN